MTLANLATEPGTKRTLRSIFDRYSDVSDDESDGVNTEDELCTVLSMLDDASLPEFDFCKKEKVSFNRSTLKVLLELVQAVAMDVLANIQIMSTNKHFCHICIKYQ